MAAAEVSIDVMLPYPSFGRVWHNFRLATVALSSPFVMASPSLLEKDALPSTNAHTTPIVPSYFTPVSPFFNAYDRITRWRQDLGLPYPGSVENTQKEVKGMYFRICFHSIPAQL